MNTIPMNLNRTAVTALTTENTLGVIMSFSHLLKRSAFFSGIALALAAATGSASAQCTGNGTCTPVSVRNVSVNATVLNVVQSPDEQAYGNRGRYTAVIYNSPDKPLPTGLMPGNYNAWCGTTDREGLNAGGYVATTSYLDAAGLKQGGRNTSGNPALVTSKLAEEATWNEINWILNHKQGYTLADVQVALWLLENAYFGGTPSAAATALYNAALTHSTYQVQPGDVMMLLLKSSSAGTLQHIIVEIPVCGWIGDRVWQDVNANGLQDVTATLNLAQNQQLVTYFGFASTGASTVGYRYTEPGINGVTVELWQNNVKIAETVTGKAPASYPYLPLGTSNDNTSGADGYYMFPNLCDGTYTVKIPSNGGQNATVLQGLVKTDQVNSPGQDSRDPDGATAVLPTVNRTGVWPDAQTGIHYDPTVDFGYKGVPTLTVSCPSTSITVGDIYNSYLTATGGVPFSSGSLYHYNWVGDPPPAWLTFNSTTGALQGAPSASGTLTFSVQAVDSQGSVSTTQSCSITVQPKPLTLACAQPAIGMVGTQYTSYLTADGGVAPYTYSVASGTLPASYLDSATGRIQFTPTTAPGYGYVAKVTDARGDTYSVQSGSCSIVIRPSIDLTCVTPKIVQGVSMTPVQLAASGGSGAGYKFTSSNLPAGLSLSTTGVLSGSATVAPGDYPITVTVTDSDNFNKTFTCITITVTAKPTTTCATITAVRGVAIAPVTLTGSGGNGGPYTFSATGLPAGLTMATDGTISGTPTVDGTFSYDITVKDKDGYANTVRCSITVNPPPSANCVTLLAVQGAAVTPVTMVGSGGTGAPYTFSVTGLPAGLTMATDGTISGTATVSGFFNYTVTVKDKDGNTGTVDCAIVVAPTVTANCVAIVAVQGLPITPVTLVGSGGNGGPYTFTATNLPAGLSISTSGVISGTPTGSGAVSYTVTVKDKDGNAGTINCSTVTVNPPVSANCASITGIVGINIAPVTLVGSGGNGGPYTFTATGLPAGVTISTSGVISGAPSVSGTFSYTVTVKDKDGNIGTVNCSTVTINPPVSATCVSITGILGISITPVTLVGTGGNGGPYTFSATGLPNGLSISTTGIISGIPLVGGAFSYTVTVTDKDGNSGTVNCSTGAVTPPPTTTCVTINALEGVAITPATMTGSGGAGAPYTFTATGLPAGLTMSTGGTISGIPTVSGTFNYTVTVKDKDGNTGTANCSVTVVAPPTATCVAISAIQGAAIAPVTMTGTGGNGGPYTFTATGLPNGLVMSTSGTISGTPTVSGPFTYTVTVKDKDGNAGTVNCSVTVNAPPTATCVAISAIQGVAIAPVTMTGTGGNGGPYTFTATGLPNGLVMSTSGTISGTPTVSGPFTYTVTVKDKDGNAGTVNCSVTVNAPPTATCVAINAIQGVAIAPVTMTGTGGNGGPYTFSATGLPNGLVMSTSGTISGVPTVSGPFTYTVTVKDKDGNTGTINCSLTVVAPPTATCVTINAIQGVAITPVTMAGAGGNGGPYTFSATGLPNGLVMSTSGTISGTPTVSGGFNYTVTVKDKDGNTGSVNCSVSVTAVPTATCVAITAYQYVTITPVTMIATGGTGGPYTFSATGLPTGLTMSSSGTISGTPTVAGTFNYTVTVMDKDGHVGQISCSVTVAPPLANVCGLTWGYWKNHASAWPAQTLSMGTKSYTNAELWAILNAPVAGDASLNLGHQLIAAKLNVLNGTRQSTDGGAITDADNLLASYSNKIPLSIGNGTSAGAQMIAIAARLDAFNQDGAAQPGCTNGPTALVAACAASTGQVGVAYNSAIVASGGISPYVYALASGSLPPGLTLNPATGAITGTPTSAGTFNYSVLVTDASYNPGDNTAVGSVTTNCSITITPAPTATCVAIAAMQGTAITPATMTATGGAGGPYTFTATGLPAGLTMSTVGTISGTPTVSGTFNYTVTVKDKNGNTGTINCSVTVAPVVVCAPTTFDLTGGNSATNGAAGNTKIFTASNGVQVKASAWSRDKSTGAWAAGWLGSYSPGLGVTDTSEDGSDPSHRVDNVGSRVNYVLFEFSSPVIVNRVYLSYVGSDSDLTAWVGTAANPFTNHLTLNDSLLAGYNKETNMASNGSDRWADINGTNLSGNVLVIAALTTETRSWDEFKIAKIETSCNTPTVPTPTASCVSIGAVQGTAITPVTMAGSGGAGGPYTFSATGLPAGLTMASDGTISGTPTVSGTFNYTVTVKDKNGVAGTLTCSVTVSPTPVCAPTTFDFTTTGTNSSTTGSAGNIRSFTAPNGLQVKVSAWARNKSTGAWSQAFLGRYSPGLGVTDNTENGSDPSHRVDNSGLVNYVMFEFSSPVKVNRAYLDYIGGDSDMAAWIGTQNNPFVNHLTMSDSLLTSLGNYEEDTSSLTSGGRWATLNSAFVQGNVLVIAALPSQADDYFKIAKIETSCAAVVTGSCVSVTAVQGVAITPVTMTAGGGTGSPYTFSASGLPAGLTMSTSGTISGTPTVSGTFAYTVTATDNSGNTSTFNCSVVVTAPPAPTATCASITAMQGAAITPVTVAGSGGAGGPYTFSASGLPAGLTMSTSGTISGTPTVSGTFAYTVTVRDKNGVAGTINCSVTVAVAVVCAPTTFDLTGGNSASTGSAGNVRTFTAANGVKVNVSGWSRDKSTGAWAKAWLGSYSPGLGVTDTSEDGSDPSHRVDNVGSRVNYVLFEFSQPVVVNKVYLAYVGGDSDISAWIGNASNPFANHLTLSDSLLSGFGVETNEASNGNDRWADINGPNESGNVLVIAARTTDTSSFDEFKLAQIMTSCNTVTVPTPTASCVTVNAVKGSAITPVKMAGSGGAGGPYTFSAVGLPSGLTMASDGTISGTPAVTGTFSYTVTVKDKNGVAGTITCSVTVSAAPVCATTTFSLTGNSTTTGSAGNIRTFTASSGVQVKASGWGRDKATGAWKPAFLGAYAQGLGVTDTAENGSDPGHRVNNTGAQLDYVMFEFSEPVNINRVYLDAVNGDSDLSVWIGTKSNPFTNHITLNDSVLSSLASFEENQTTSSSARWADINGTNIYGNVLVVAAMVSDDSPEDYFKISKLETSCSTTPKPISVGDYATATQGGWGAPPSGSNIAMYLKNYWSTVYPSGSVSVGGTYKLTCTSSTAIANFLPQGGTAGKLTSSATNPTTSAAGVLAGQLMAAQLNLDFSTKGVSGYGLGSLYVVSGPMAGKTVAEVVSIGNSVMGGGAVPSGLTISDIVTTLDGINNNFDGGTVNKGYLRR